MTMQILGVFGAAVGCLCMLAELVREIAPYREHLRDAQSAAWMLAIAGLWSPLPALVFGTLYLTLSVWAMNRKRPGFQIKVPVEGLVLVTESPKSGNRFGYAWSSARDFLDRKPSMPLPGMRECVYPDSREVLLNAGYYGTAFNEAGLAALGIRTVQDLLQRPDTFEVLRQQAGTGTPDKGGPSCS